MKIATALLLAVCLATITAAVPLAALGGRLDTVTAWLALATGLAGATFFWITSGPAPSPLRMGWADWAASGLFALGALRAFLWLVFFNGDSIEVLSPNNLGDLPLHLTYIRYFAKGAKFWPQTPIFSGFPLHYPAGIDLFNALLHRIGCDDFRALIWVGLVASAVTCYFLLRWGGWFAVLGFLCNSGLAGWKFFHHFAFRIEDYQQAVDWKSIPLSMFVTQRGLLYSIPAGLLLLCAWRARWFRDSADSNPPFRNPLWVEVALYATMPLFHLHTFLFLSALLGWWIAFGHKETPSLRREALDLVLWAVVPATVCVSLVTGLFQRGSNAASVIHLKPGWLQDGQGFFRYWFVNFGILPLLAAALLAWVIIRFHKTLAARNAFAFVLPSLLVFLTACVVMFAPWDWDNTKIMIWAYLAILPFLHEMLLEIPGPAWVAIEAQSGDWRSRAPVSGLATLPIGTLRPIGVPIRILTYILLFFSGFISLLGGLDASHTGYEIAKRSELDPIEFSVRSLPPDSTFAGCPTYNHPLLLCGCKMVEGYAGHLFSHGIDYQARDEQLTALMSGAPNWRSIASSLGVQYLFWGSREMEAYPESTQPWKLAAPVLAAGPWGVIYDLAAPLPNVANLPSGHASGN